MYVGEYKDLLRHGQGSYTFPGSHFHYSGEWRRGNMHGQGEFTMSDGTTYEGEFLDGEIEGVGLKRWPDGSSYSGQFHQGEMHGEGIYISTKGERYEGHWESNRRCGYGVLQLPDGNSYSGEFVAHLPSGRGKMAYAATGAIYDGEWVAGARCGIGQLVDAGGNRLYEGCWRDDHRQGDGVGTLPVDNIADNGVSSSLWYDGRWKNDEPEVRTTKIVVMTMTKRLGSRPATANANQAEQPQAELHELPAQLVVENKRIPTLTVVCTGRSEDQNETSGDVIRVQGEHGRRFRLRIFEGAVPCKTSEGVVADVVAGSPWQFVRSSSHGKLDLHSESEQPVSSGPAVIPANDKVTNGHGSVEDAQIPDEPAETRSHVVHTQATGGLAVFHDLLLPATTLIGDYYLVCESLASDSLPPAFIPLSIQ